MSLDLTAYIKAEVVVFENWEHKAAQDISAFMHAFLADVKGGVEKAILSDIRNILPQVLKALGSAPMQNLGKALVVAEAAIVPLLLSQGITLYQTSINILVNMIVGYVQSLLGNKQKVVTAEAAADQLVAALAAPVAAITASVTLTKQETVTGEVQASPSPATGDNPAAANTNTAVPAEGAE